MKRTNLLMLTASVVLGFNTTAMSQVAPETLEPLRVTTTPLPNLAGIVVNVAAAKQLGKALFWDINTGSDGMACASCHYAGGADVRIQNTLSPGFPDQRWDGGSKVFGGIEFSSVSGMNAAGWAAMQPWQGDFSPAGTAGLTAARDVPAVPGRWLVPNDFPTHQLLDLNDRNSEIVYTTNDAVSSQGTKPATFDSANPVDGTGELCTPELDSPFLEVNAIGNVLLRAVEPRNTPTTINAGFQKRNFWDGRANNTFNGFDPFGRRSPSAAVLEYNSKTNKTFGTRLVLPNAALASQSVGPPLSHVEMSCGGKTFPILGRKMLALQALQSQQIHPTDSVLAAIALNKPKYDALVKKAFDPKWWAAPATAKFNRNKSAILVDTKGFTQMEFNFSMFMGISVMLYESTLVSGQTAFDKTLGGAGPRLMNVKEKAGMAVFNGKGKCIACHAGPILSKGTVAEVEFMTTGDGGTSFYDGSFYNIGVNYTVTDNGVGQTDPWGNPLSYTRQLLSGKIFDNFKANLCTTEVVPFAFTGTCVPATQLAQAQANAAAQRVSLDGAMQTPTLRNVGLTPPYFHNGSVKTLAELVDVYNRGLNMRGPLGSDTTGSGRLGRPQGEGSLVGGYRTGSNLPPEIGKLGLTPTEATQLVAFLLALTDNRVACDQAPFDHPNLPIPAPGGTLVQFNLPAVGSSGLGGIGRTCRPNSGNLFTEYSHLATMK